MLSRLINFNTIGHIGIGYSNEYYVMQTYESDVMVTDDLRHIDDLVSNELDAYGEPLVNYENYFSNILPYSPGTQISSDLQIYSFNARLLFYLCDDEGDFSIRLLLQDEFNAYILYMCYEDLSGVYRTKLICSDDINDILVACTMVRVLPEFRDFIQNCLGITVNVNTPLLDTITENYVSDLLVSVVHYVHPGVNYLLEYSLYRAVSGNYILTAYTEASSPTLNIWHLTSMGNMYQFLHRQICDAIRHISGCKNNSIRSNV